MMDGEANIAERRRWNDEYWSSIWLKREVLASSVTGVLMSHLGLRLGERVMDVGCGGGATTIAAGALVGPTGSAVGVDISDPLLTLARRRAQDQQASNVVFALADAQSDAVPGAPFDIAMSQFGVMFFDEPVRAFTNIRRQVVPGGRLGFACWQENDRNPWLIGQALAPFVPAPPPPAPGKSPTGPFSLSDPDHTAELLTRSGWTSLTRTAYDLVANVDREAIVDDDQLTFYGVPDASLDAARSAVDQHLRPFQSDDGRINAPLAVQVFTAAAP